MIDYVKRNKEVFTMGLKFERTDNLDKLFESFAVDQKKTVAPKEEIDRFLKPQPQKEKKKDKKQK